MTRGPADTSVFIARESGRTLDLDAVSVVTIGELRAGVLSTGDTSSLAAVVAGSMSDDIGWTAALIVSSVVSALTAGSAWFGLRIYRRVVSGDLGSNGWAGIRTSATTKSEEAWMTAHEVGGPMSFRGFQVMALSALAAVPGGVAIAVARDGSASTHMTWWTTILLIGAMAGLVPLSYGALLGHRAAKALPDPPTDAK